MKALEHLKEMVGKLFLYNNEETVIISYCDGVGEDGDEVEIYLNNGKTLCWNISDLPTRLCRFHPISKTVIVLANERLNKVSTLNPTIIGDLRDTILSQIKAVKDDAGAVPQAKQVFQGVNTLINLAKTELAYRQYLDKNLPHPMKNEKV